MLISSMLFEWLFQETLAALEILVKKHDAFEKTLSTQEERFIALENLTTVSCYFC